MNGFPPENAPPLLPSDTGSWYQVRIGLPRPDWTKVGQWIDRNVADPQQDLAWCQAACDWLSRLGDALGKGYLVHESPIFFMLMSGSNERAEEMLAFLESERRRICKALGGAAFTNYCGKPVVIVLAAQDEYYSYIADYSPTEGEFGLSGGHCIGKGYGHIVLPEDAFGGLSFTVPHEMVHACLMHLKLPAWLDEGLAVGLSYAPGYTLDHWLPRCMGGDVGTATARYRQKWNSETIQLFWSGRSFSSPDDDQHFSYILANELTKRLSRHRKFKEFVLNADWVDAGSAAAKEILKVDLGEAMVTFLGAGDWRPRPDTWEPPDNPKPLPVN